jgi:hypothetical protein
MELLFHAWPIVGGSAAQVKDFWRSREEWTSRSVSFVYDRQGSKRVGFGRSPGTGDQDSEMTMGQRRHTTTTGRRRLSALLVAAILVLAIPVALSTAGAAPGQRIDLKVLVVAPTADDPVAAAWKAALDGEGVPNDVRVLNDGAPDLGDGDLADYGANRAYYQAVIVAWGNMPMAAGETAALEKLERTFGIRSLRDNTTPGPEFGMNPATNVGEQGPGTSTLTAAGKSVFPYLHGTVPIDEFAFGYQATPASPAFTTLLSGPGNSAYLGIHRRADGQEEMISMLTGGRFQTHHQLLRHGLISWLTGGVFLGYQRYYYAMHVDDIFMPNDRWDVNANRTGVDEPTTHPDEYQCDREPGGFPDCLPPIRMTEADVTRLISWQNANGLRLDMLFNGHGHDEQMMETGSDPLANALLAQRSRFYWVNHTYSHPKLYTAPRSTIVDEIRRNVQWAADHGINIDPTELVTGEHSGLDNPEMPGALADAGVRSIGSDNSRESSQRAIGPATTVPRFPSNVYYNVGTRAEQLDEYNYIYLPASLGGKCVNTPTNTCRTAPITDFQEYVDSEANIMFDHVMDNDPRPHYSHQSNITLENPADGEAVLYTVVKGVLDRYRPYLSVPIVQLTQTQIGEHMQRRSQWNANRGSVSAYLQDGQVHFTNSSTQAIEVPITGTAIGDVYGGQRSGWVTVAGRSSETAQPGPGTGTAKPVRMSLTGLKIKPKRFATTGRRKGATVSWRVSHAGTLKLAVQRKTRGRKVGKSCKKQTNRNRKRKACTRYVSVGTITRSAKQGNGRYKWTGKVKRRRLKTGTYRLVGTATAKDRSVLPSAAGRVTFKVVKAKKAKSKRR